MIKIPLTAQHIARWLKENHWEKEEENLESKTLSFFGTLSLSSSSSSTLPLPVPPPQSSIQMKTNQEQQSVRATLNLKFSFLDPTEKVANCSQTSDWIGLDHRRRQWRETTLFPLLTAYYIADTREQRSRQHHPLISRRLSGSILITINLANRSKIRTSLRWIACELIIA